MKKYQQLGSLIMKAIIQLCGSSNINGGITRGESKKSRWAGVQFDRFQIGPGVLSNKF